MKHHTQIRDAHESRVLVVYTGGTIGMLSGIQGYSPLPGYLSEHLRSQPRFHDPSSSSLCANSRSVDAFRSWQSLVSLNTPPSTATSGEFPTPDLRSEARSPKDMNSTHHNQLKVVTQNGPKWLDSLVMPESQECPKIRYAILEFERLIDSSEIEISDYHAICQSIRQNYQLFDGFVILHGTDTMSYTASALSFLLENLGKSVILTGAQIPLSSPRNDAVENLLGALQIAGTYLIPEVSLYFNHRLWRGNRTMKVSSVEFDAFKSCNLEPLVKVGCNVEIRWDLIAKPVERKPFTVHDSMCESVAVLRLFPSITPASVRAFLSSPIRGIVLETFGSGNAPRKPEFLEAFREASERGVVIVNVTQCATGTVSSEIYETGRALAEVGIVGGRDMTTECALAKLGYLLSKSNLSLDQIRKLISEPLRGELTLPARAQFEPQPAEDKLSWLIKQISSLHLPDDSATFSRSPASIFRRLSITSSPGLPGSLQHDSRQVSTSTSITLTTATQAHQTPSLDTYADVGVDLPTSDIVQAEYERLQRSLLPLSVISAASSNDCTLDEILTANSTMIKTMGLLNQRTTAGLGQTALHVAAFHGRLANLELLLDHGASVHLRDDCGHTALYYSIVNEHRSCVNALKRVGAHLADHEIEQIPPGPDFDLIGTLESSTAS